LLSFSLALCWIILSTLSFLITFNVGLFFGSIYYSGYGASILKGIASILKGIAIVFNPLAYVGSLVGGIGVIICYTIAVTIPHTLVVQESAWILISIQILLLFMTIFLFSTAKPLLLGKIFVFGVCQIWQYVVASETKLEFEDYKNYSLDPKNPSNGKPWNGKYFTVVCMRIHTLLSFIGQNGVGICGVPPEPPRDYEYYYPKLQGNIHLVFECLTVFQFLAAVSFSVLFLIALVNKVWNHYQDRRVVFGTIKLDV